MQKTQKYFQRNNQRQHFESPTEFPAGFEYKNPDAGVEVTIPVADQEAWVNLLMNVGKLEPGQVRRLVVDEKGRPWKVEDLFAVARKDKDGNPVQLRISKLDGPAVVCVFHGGEYEPMTAPFEFEDGTINDEGGSFLKLKTEQVEALVKTMSPEKAQKFRGTITEATNSIMDGAKAESKMLVAPTCRRCREQMRADGFVGLRYVRREVARRELGEAEMQDMISSIAAGLGFKRRENDRGKPRFRQNSGSRRFDHERKEPKPRREWHGADLEARTADMLDEAGYPDLISAIEAGESGKLEQQKIAHPKSIGPILSALKRAQEGRMVIGEASSAQSIANKDGEEGKPKSSAKPGTPAKPKSSAKSKPRDVKVQGGQKQVAVPLAGLRA